MAVQLYMSGKYPSQVHGQLLKDTVFFKKKVIPLLKCVSVVSVSVFLEMQCLKILTHGDTCKNCTAKRHPCQEVSQCNKFHNLFLN